MNPPGPPNGLFRNFRPMLMRSAATFIWTPNEQPQSDESDSTLSMAMRRQAESNSVPRTVQDIQISSFQPLSDSFDGASPTSPADSNRIQSGIYTSAGSDLQTWPAQPWPVYINSSLRIPSGPSPRYLAESAGDGLAPEGESLDYEPPPGLLPALSIASSSPSQQLDQLDDCPSQPEGLINSPEAGGSQSSQTDRNVVLHRSASINAARSPSFGMNANVVADSTQTPSRRPVALSLDSLTSTRVTPATASRRRALSSAGGHSLDLASSHNTWPRSSFQIDFSKKRLPSFGVVQPTQVFTSSPSSRLVPVRVETRNSLAQSPVSDVPIDQRNSQNDSGYVQPSSPCPSPARKRARLNAPDTEGLRLPFPTTSAQPDIDKSMDQDLELPADWSGSVSDADAAGETDPEYDCELSVSLALGQSQRASASNAPSAPKRIVLKITSLSASSNAGVSKTAKDTPKAEEQKASNTSKSQLPVSATRSTASEKTTLAERPPTEDPAPLAASRQNGHYLQRAGPFGGLGSRTPAVAQESGSRVAHLRPDVGPLSDLSVSSSTSHSHSVSMVERAAEVLTALRASQDGVSSQPLTIDEPERSKVTHEEAHSRTKGDFVSPMGAQDEVSSAPSSPLSSVSSDHDESPRNKAPAASSSAEALIPAAENESEYLVSDQLRDFPDGVPIIPGFQLFYQRYFVPSSLPPEEWATLFGGLDPQWNDQRRSLSDLYNYHMQYQHGISALTGEPFAPPVAVRTMERKVVDVRHAEKETIVEGKFVPIESFRQIDIKIPEIIWWKHAHSCHKKSSALEGTGGIFVDNEFTRRVTAYVHEKQGHDEA
ncbi:hypothetical protein OC861_002515 [Tilletia horrida]|nr:hypothetical protein OC861_002515 [Tilletia horrida]